MACIARERTREAEGSRLPQETVARRCRGAENCAKVLTGLERKWPLNRRMKASLESEFPWLSTGTNATEGFGLFYRGRTPAALNPCRPCYFASGSSWENRLMATLRGFARRKQLLHVHTLFTHISKPWCRNHPCPSYTHTTPY